MPDEPKAWLFAAARYEWLNHRKASARHRVVLVDVATLAAAVVTDDDGAEVCARVDLVAPFAQLTRDDQLLLQLVYLEDAEPALVAQVFRVRPEALRARLTRARRRLRRAVERINGGPVVRPATDCGEGDGHG